jgi:hypothetical protein
LKIERLLWKRFKGLSVRRLNGDEQNAEDYAEMHVTLGARFPVFVQFEGDQKASC